MKGFIFALRVSATDSLKKWTDIYKSFTNGFPPGLAIAGHSPPPLPFYNDGKQLDVNTDKKSEGFLWGVPKHRRTVEKRMTRKFGMKEWVYKMLIPKYNLLVCDNCGHHYEAKHLCRNCYEKNKEETKIIRESIGAKFGDSPIDKDVVVLYESDKGNDDNMERTVVPRAAGKLLIEIPKDRPSFFSPNLLQKSTTGINKRAKDVTPTNPAPIVHKTESNVN